MSIEVIHINGKNPNLNYEQFEQDAKLWLGRTCSQAKIYLLNDFPAAVSYTTDVDLLIIIVLKDVQGNYLIVRRKENDESSNDYLKSVVIPIVFSNDFSGKNIEVVGDSIYQENSETEFSSEIQGLKKGFGKYLNKRCGFDQGQFEVFPLFFIKNERIKGPSKDLIVGSELTFESIISFLRFNKRSYNSYKYWTQEDSFKELSSDINKILEQASFDSKEGYLTKSKIERLSVQQFQNRKIFEELGHKLILVKGKAGSGKSSELLALTLKTIQKDKNALFLTYNKLLVFELARLVKSFRNENQDKIKLKRSSVQTLGQYFYKLSNRLGVQHVLSAERIENLTMALNNRTRRLFDYLSSMENQLPLNEVKEKIQNVSEDQLSLEIKDLGIDFVQFLEKQGVFNLHNIKKNIRNFYELKKAQLDRIETKKIFLKDYTGVLENTLLQLNDPGTFYDTYNLRERLELIRRPININPDQVERDINGKSYITKEKFEALIGKKKNRSIWNRALFVDEGQDCHWLEKEILVTIFGRSAIAVADGGKEQLIRQNTLCNWERFAGRAMDVSKFYKRKSFRTKKSISEFCNYIGEQYHVDLELNSIESLDAGRLILDFRTGTAEEEFFDFNSLMANGKVQGCSPNESLLFLTNPGYGEGSESIESSYINEYGNIQESSERNRSIDSDFNKVKDSSKYHPWNGMNKDKEIDGLPYSNDIRFIYYESCRGLEGWTVVCKNIDKFFDRKKENPDAEKYLAGDEKKMNVQDLFKLSNEERKSMYAATWVLMALTRAIDTLYVTADRNSELGAVLYEYGLSRPANVTFLTD